MRYALSLWLIALWMVGDGCSEKESQWPLDSGDGSGATAVDTVTFADTGLEVAIRAALDKSEEVLTGEDLLLLTQLDASGREIIALNGIEQLENLVGLDLGDNRIVDISALAGLAQLKFLALDNNQLKDISPLTALAQLQVLSLENNQIEDISLLLGLEKLENVELAGNPLTENDMAALQERGIEVGWAVEEVDTDPLASADFRMAFDSDREGNPEIYVMALGGSEPVNLTQHPASDVEPAWAPDGQRIAFVSNRSRDVEIYVMEADENAPTNLTHSPGGDFSPSWAPDGQRIAFSSFRDGNSEIYVMEADGRNPTNLTHDPSFDTSPSWSPDGSQIAFESDRDGDFEIYVMDVDGGDPIRLTNYNQTMSLRFDWVASAAPAFDEVRESPPAGLFADPLLEIAVRARLGKTDSEELTEKDLLLITALDLNNSQVSDLSGIGHLSNLERLDLNNRTVWKTQSQAELDSVHMHLELWN